MSELSYDAAFLRKKAFNIRKHIITTVVNNGEGHAGPALSCADILSVLYMGIMGEDDRFILSAGHKCLALYGALVEKGVVDRSVLDTYNQLGSPVPGHPDMTKLPGVEFSTGSLGHGLPLGCGLALAAKMQNKNYKTYVLMGDGEQGEGSNWEAAAFAAQKKLDNLVAIIDENGLQINGTTKEILKPTSYEARYGSFGWAVKVVNGHSVEEIYETLSSAPFEAGRPSLIVAKTIKGKGLSFAENNVNYHHWNPDKEEADKALAELKALEKGCM
ncbi:MAG: transketolase [Tepidanaerobacteraceae bacterium]|nr:transketolase [Tepidanaerobacteraceae bacterium]